MKKTTAELMKELESFESFQLFRSQNREQLGETPLHEALQALLADKNLEKAKVIERAQMSEIYAYQVFSGTRSHPRRGKLLSLAVGMGLSLAETQTLLKQTGYAPLYPKLPFDAVVIYGLCKGLDVCQINTLLYENKLETLG